MKKLVAILVICFAGSVFANLPDIVALVNDEPITKYDFVSRKKLVTVLNNVDTSDPSVEAALNRNILNALIEEALLRQHADKVGGKISKEQVDNAILTIEQRNNMPKGGIKILLKEKGLEMESFRKQITGEIIKANIINSLSDSVSVSPSELDMAVANTSSSEFKIEAWIFTSRGAESADYKKMQNLKKRLHDCNKVDTKLYDDFADAEKFDRNLKDMAATTQSIIHDTKIGSTSSIYKENDKLKLVFVCKKDAIVSPDNLSNLKTFLSNKKMSQKAIKFFKTLKTRANIKVMIPN
ncbi:MAG: hypothetical protein Tsb006_2600 [Rickettsiaceae bacterium]